MSFIVDNDDIFLGIQIAANPAHHLVGRFGEGACLAVRKNRLRDFSGGDFLPQLEGMKIGDDDFCLSKFLKLLSGYNIPHAVVVPRIVRKQHAEPVADRNARGDNQEGIGESSILRVGALIQGVPGDEHGHDHGFAGAGRHLEGGTRQAGIRGAIRIPKRVFDPAVAVLLCCLGEVNGCFERLILAEEDLLFAGGIGPVCNQAGGGRRHAGISAFAPHADPSPNFIHKLILFYPVLRPLRIKTKLKASLLLRSGDGHEIGAGPALLDNLIGNAVVVKAEMPLGFIEGRIENRVFYDDLGHGVDTLALSGEEKAIGSKEYK